jgi:hypothetical protein
MATWLTVSSLVGWSGCPISVRLLDPAIYIYSMVLDTICFMFSMDCNDQCCCFFVWLCFWLCKILWLGSKLDMIVVHLNIFFQ